eukprot:3633698-Karenia_brevis.AAC.1
MADQYVCHAQLEAMFAQHQQDLFSKLDEVKTATASSQALLFQQVSTCVEQTIQPVRKAVGVHQQQLETMRLTLELHNQRFEKLEKQMECDRAPSSAANST